MVTVALKLKDAFWKKSYDKPRQCIKKERDHFVDSGLCSQTGILPVVMYGCESWLQGRLNTEELMLLICGVRETLESPWTARPNQSILKEISPECSLEWPLLKLRHLMRRTGSLERTQILWKTEGITEDEMVEWHYWLNGHEFKQTLGDSERQGSLRAAVLGVAKERSNWTTNNSNNRKPVQMN